jgi:hypothetical protein
MKYQEMSNAELKLEIEKLFNEFEAEKRKVVSICENMEKIEQKYLTAKKELDMRKNIYL